jgi:hypothetical protein
MKLPFVENYVEKLLMQLPPAQMEQSQYVIGQSHKDFVNIVSQNDSLSTYKNLTAKQKIQQREIIAKQMEQNKNTREKQNNEER